jgi:hypothetical protein
MMRAAIAALLAALGCGHAVAAERVVSATFTAAAVSSTGTLTVTATQH